MKSRVVNAISIIAVIVGLLAILYPKYEEKHSQKVNTELIDVVWNLMDEEYIDSDLGLGSEEEIDVYHGLDETNNEIAKQEYTNLQLQDETTKDGVELTLEEKKERLLEQNLVYGIIEMPELEEYYAVVKGTATDELRIAIGHLYGTAHFGQVGNCVLAGHRGGLSGIFFKNIDQLREGSKVLVTNMRKETFTYEVYEQFVADRSEAEYIAPIGEEKTLTLISGEEQGRKRLIVRCRIVEE